MGDDDIVKEFLVESYENLDRLDRDLLELEKDPTAQEILASIFRTIHTIKGTCGFLGFGQLEKVAHVGENLLSRLRDGLLQLNEEITTVLLKLVDSIREMLTSIESSGGEGERDDQELIATLTRLLESGYAQAAPTKDQPAAAASEPAVLPAPEVHPALAPEAGGEAPAHADAAAEKRAARPPDSPDATPGPSKQPNVGDTTIRVDVSLLDQLMNLVGELVLARNQILQFTNSAKEAGLLATSQRLNLITTELQEGVMKTRMQPIGNVWSKFPRIVRDLALGCGKQVHIEMEGKETELDKTIIEAIKDPLTHLVRNAVDHGIEAPDIRRHAGKNPEGNLFLRAFHEGGQVNIEISDDGAGLNLEKIRNKAVQKGLITSDQALRMSDREVANLIFMAGLSTADKVTNVSGRGVGMDVVKTNIEKIGGTVDVQTKVGIGSTIRVKIPLTLAIIPALMVTSGGDRYAIPQVSLLELVGLEGEQARKGIELIQDTPVYRLRGRLLPLVYLNRELGVGERSADGTKAAPVHGLDFAQAKSGHQRWIDRLRQVLDGTVSLPPDQAGSPHDCTLGAWLRGRALLHYGDLTELSMLRATHQQFHACVRTLLTLRDQGDQEAAAQELIQAEALSKRIADLLELVEKKVAEAQRVSIVILQAEDRQFGLVVDAISDTEEIVVKPLSKQLKGISVYAGATILGDGRVALILDVLGLAQSAHVVGEAHDHAAGELDRAGVGASHRNPVLLFQYGESGRMAIDLSLVARLEEFRRDAVEVAGGQQVVQYRDQIMPLIDVSRLLKARSGNPPEDPMIQVIVYSDHGRSVGLVIDRILDIVDDVLVVQKDTGRKGIVGSAVIQKRITDILNVPELIAMALPQAGTAQAHA